MQTISFPPEGCPADVPPSDLFSIVLFFFSVCLSSKLSFSPITTLSVNQVLHQPVHCRTRFREMVWVHKGAEGKGITFSLFFILDDLLNFCLQRSLVTIRHPRLNKVTKQERVLLGKSQGSLLFSWDR